MRLASLSLIALLLPVNACVDTDCTPTKLKAEDAHFVVVEDAWESGVFEGLLTTVQGGPIGGKVVAFRIDGDEMGSNATEDSGRARFDLKDDPLEVRKLIGSDHYTVAFDGDGKFCASADQGTMDLVKK